MHRTLRRPKPWKQHGTEVKWHPKTEWDKMVVILVILSVQFGFVYRFNRE